MNGVHLIGVLFSFKHGVLLRNLREVCLTVKFLVDLCTCTSTFS